MVPNTLISHLTVTDEQFRVVLAKLRFARHASKSELVLKMTYDFVIGIEAILNNNITPRMRVLLLKTATKY